MEQKWIPDSWYQYIHTCIHTHSNYFVHRLLFFRRLKCDLTNCCLFKKLKKKYINSSFSQDFIINIIQKKDLVWSTTSLWNTSQAWHLAIHSTGPSNFPEEKFKDFILYTFYQGRQNLNTTAFFHYYHIKCSVVRCPEKNVRILYRDRVKRNRTE